MSSIHNSIAQSSNLVKSLLLNFFITLLLVSSAYAAPSSADLSTSVHGSETGAASVEYTVTLDSVNDTGMPIIFRIDSNGGTATSGADYTDFDNMFVGVIPGATTGTFNVAVLEDVLFENTETVNAIITGTASSAGITINTPTASANIVDNDNAAGSINANLSVTTDGDETGPVNIVYTVTLAVTNNTHGTIDFDIDPTGGTAVAASDYVNFAGGTISVADGSSTGTFTVAVIDDNVIENLETVTATIDDESDPAINIVTASDTADIVDNDSGAGTVDADLSVTTQGDEDGPIDVTYTVTLAKTNGTGVPISFNINPSGGTAVVGTDFTDFTGGTISVPDGSATGTFDATVLDDAIFDGTRTVQATIDTPTHVAIDINTASATANIADDEIANAVLSTTANGDENGPVDVQYTVTLSTTNDTGVAVTFDIDPSGGTATAGADYTDFAGGTISVANGATTGTFNVTVADDMLFENNETVQATISNPSNGNVNITTASSSATIADDDNAAGSINADLSTTQNGAEAGPVDIIFTVTLAKTNNTGGAITFDIDPNAGNAAPGSDFVDYAGGSISVPNGSNTGSFTVTVIDDAVFESNEVTVAVITNPSDPAININNPGAGGTITDNETATADLSVDTDGNEAGPIDIVFRVTLSTTNNTGSAIGFNIDPNAGNATPGADFVDYTGLIFVPDGSSSGTVTVTVIDDALLEGDEVTVAVISGPSDPDVTINNPGAGAHITSDDTATADLSVSVNGDEAGATSIEYTVTLSTTNNSGSGINFDINPTGGSATAGADYTDFTNGTISVANGSTTGTLVVPVSDDALFENDETAQATISNPSLAAVTITTASATATIFDDDNAAGSVNADLSVTTHGDEDGDVDVVYTVTLAKVNNTGGAITFDIDPTVNGTAVAGTDYTDFTGGSISVPNGSATGTFTVDELDDALFDGNRTLEAIISSASDPAININTAAATANIADDEQPDASISVTTNGDETGPVDVVYTVTLSLTNNTGGNVTFDIDPGSDTATAGSDYVDFAGASVTIADGMTTGTYTVTVNDDALYENDETVVATISNPSPANINIVIASATATLADDDNTGITANLAATTSGDETGPVSLVYTVTISTTNNTGAAVTFDIDPSGGNSTHTQDYTNFAGGAISIPNGSATGTFNVTIVDDMRFENNETLQATISDVSDPAAITIVTASATGTIIDNDNAPGSVDANLVLTNNATENGSAFVGYTITLEKANHTHQAITFDIDPTGGTATAGTDYADFTGNTISVPDGASFATIVIPVIDDMLLEGTETLTTTIANANDPAIGIVTASSTGNILDDDDAVATLSVTTNGSETGPVSIVYTVTINKTNNTGAAITFSTAPTGGTATATTDYTNFNGSLIIIANGVTTGTLTVPVVNDALFENTETVQATITNPSIADVTIGTGAVTAMITDNDNTPGSIGANLSVTTHGDEDGPQSIVFTVTLAQPNTTGSAVTVDIARFAGTATLGADFSFSSSTVTIANNSSTGTTSVNVVDDSLFENTETLEATISNPSDPAIFINTPNAIANIADDDNTAASVDANLSATTNGSETGPVNIVYTVTLESANNTGSALNFSIAPSGGTATAGSDYVGFAGGTISVANGATTGTFTVTVTDDALFENTETVQATISAASDPAINIATASATANITDNDNTALSISADLSVTTNGSEAGPVNIVYTVTLGTVNNTGGALNFSIAPSGGTATAGSDYVTFAGGIISVANGATTGTFTVTVTNDALFENTETVQATISNSSDPAINIVTSTVSANITDNDNTVGTINADLSVITHGDEAGTVNAVYRVTLASVNNTGSAITFNIAPTGGDAAAGSDYINFSGSTITVANGATTGTLVVAVNDDSLFENTEIIEATISGASDPAININTAVANANIADNDNVAVGADLSVTTHGNETGPVSIVYTVTIANTNNTGSSITFDIDPTGGTATADSDYTDFSGASLVVANGTSSASITVAVADDSLFENTETVEAKISNVSDPAISINTASVTANITDNDNAVGSIAANLSVTADGNETGPVDVVFTVTIGTTNNTGGPITFDINPTGGTATAGSDYADFAGGTITVADGMATGTLTVAVTDDSDSENLEMLQATISNSSDPAVAIVLASATANIVDNDEFVLIEPVYSLWNGFLGQINVIALANKGEVPTTVTATLFDLNGTQLGTQNILLDPADEFDLIVNDLPGFAVDTYGVVKIEFDQPIALEGHSATYRVSSATPSEFDFAIIRPFSNAISGTSNAFFNTFQPSQNEEDASNVVYSFAQIVNLSDSTKIFNVVTNSANGTQLASRNVVIPAGGRRDVEAGHETPGAGNVGRISITPVDGMGALDASANYIAQIATYGADQPAGVAPTGFDFAFSEEFRPGNANSQFINVSSGSGAMNWLAIANTDLAAQSVNVRLINNAGTELVNSDVAISAGAQVHLSPNDFLAAGSSGIVILTPEVGKTIIANGRAYYLDSASGVSSASLEESREIVRGPLNSTYNTFINNLNWLRVFNVGKNDVSINIELFGVNGASLGSANVSLNALTGKDLELSSSLGITVPVNAYGIVRITSNDDISIVSHLLRLKFGSSGAVDLANTLPLR